MKQEFYEMHIRFPLSWKSDLERWKKDEERPLSWLVVKNVGKTLQSRKRKKRAEKVSE